MEERKIFRRFKTKNNDNDHIPILRFGPNNNLIRFKRTIIVKAGEKFGSLAKTLELMAYYVTPEVDITEFDLVNDPHGLNLMSLQENIRARIKREQKMLEDRHNMYSFIYSHLSEESIDEIKQVEGYEEFDTNKDPLELWKAIISTHMITENTLDEGMLRRDAREQYKNCLQGEHESIVRYHERFNTILQHHNQTGNAAMDPADIALDFMYGLDEKRYHLFKNEYINSINIGYGDRATTLNEMYLKATKYKPPRQPKVTNQHTDNEAKEEQTTKIHHNIKCYNCNQFGHYKSDCPEPTKRYARHTVLTSSLKGNEKEFEVLLDNQADISIMNRRFLKNIKRLDEPIEVIGINGGTIKLFEEGDFKNIIKCYVATNECKANILCQADIEDKYKINYVQQSKYVVELEDVNIVFERKNKLYVADLSNWIEDEDEPERRALYTKSDIKRAKEAQDFIINAGFPSEQAAVNMIENGDIIESPITRDDIKLANEIYGKHPSI